jgi:hypothetical protein
MRTAILVREIFRHSVLPVQERTEDLLLSAIVSMDSILKGEEIVSNVPINVLPVILREMRSQMSILPSAQPVEVISDLPLLLNVHVVMDIMMMG